MFYKVTLACVLLVISLQGFGASSAKSVEPGDKNSFALGVVLASGALKSLRDIEVPDEQRADFINPRMNDVAWLKLSRTNPLERLSGKSFPGGNTSPWKFIGRDLAKESRVIAWLPKTTASANPKQALSDVLTAAYVATAKEYKFESTVGGGGAKGFVALSSVNFSNAVIVGFNDPVEVANPDFLGNGRSYLFSTSEEDEKRAALNWNKFEQISDANFLLAFSKRLPAWVFLYIAPGRLKDERGAEIKMPMLLSKGEIHLFVR